MKFNLFNLLKYFVFLLSIFLGGNASMVLADCVPGSTYALATGDVASGHPLLRVTNSRSLVIKRNVSPNQLHSVEGATGLVCGENAWCGDLGRDYYQVSGQYGFYYTDPDYGLLFFDVASVEAVSTGQAGQYAAAKWEDGKLLWIQVNPNGNPMELQTLFFGHPTDYPNCTSQYVQYIFYKQAGVDYSGWTFGASLSVMEVIVDAEYHVVDYFIYVYDDDDNYLETRKLGDGDSIQTLYYGALVLEPEYVLLYYIDDFTTVAGEPVFEYSEKVPGTDFSCPYLTVDLLKERFYFRLEAYDEDGYIPTWSEAQYIGTAAQIMGRTSGGPQGSGGGGCFLGVNITNNTKNLPAVAGLLLSLVFGAWLFIRKRRRNR